MGPVAGRLPLCSLAPELEGVVREKRIGAPTPIALVAQQDLVGRSEPVAQDGLDGLQENALIRALGIGEGAPLQAGLSDRQRLLGQLEDARAAERRAQRR